MALLKKIKAATLMETLVATVLIVLVFMISTFLLNSLFNNTVRQNTDALKTHISELAYLSIHHQISVPYDEVFDNWDISVERVDNKLIFEAIHQKTSKTIRVEHYE
ncbi:hypothetical protein [Kordia zhangzhouensis]|uniref:hypothetical protein n=1 Tax=Kordia zhangzhouensis TaxID=1620405 RepID=UPI000629C529|nr:hypothetical protein [Kordia zhangzhouensis]